MRTIFLSFVCFTIFGFINKCTCSENTIEGTWFCTDRNNEIDFFICVYNAPKNHQYGYMVYRQNQYKVIPLDSISKNGNKVFIGSKISGRKIEGELKSINDIEAVMTMGSGNEMYVFNVVLKKADVLPSWVTGIKNKVYKDGTYKAKGEISPYGFTPYAEVTVKNSRIVNVIYFERNDSTGELKDNNYGKNYIETWGEMLYVEAQNAVHGTQTYPYKLILSQNTDNIDAVSGATVSYNRFKYVINKALEDAEFDDKNP